MKKTFLILFLGILFLGCSSNEDDNNTTSEDFNLIIDGVGLHIPTTGASSFGQGVRVNRKGDFYSVNYLSIGDLSYTDSLFNMSLIFTKEGKFVKGGITFNSYNLVNPGYYNFQHFPSNYFQAISMAIDESAKRIKIKFSGKLYQNPLLLASDSRDIQGEVDMPYIDDGDTNNPLVFNNIEQYCRADINAIPWRALFEHNYSSFTNEDDYKIETHFANASAAGSFNFDALSTDNYVRLSKFNTTTQTYDYYNATGVVAYSYSEFHGANKYSFIGSFSFTATNPNNASDIIQVTNGEFRSYQQF